MKLNVEWFKKHIARTSGAPLPSSDRDRDRSRHCDRPRYPDSRMPCDYNRDYDRNYRRKSAYDRYDCRDRDADRDRDCDRDYDRRYGRDRDRDRYDRDRDDPPRYDRSRHERERRDRDRDRDRDRYDSDDRDDKHDRSRDRNPSSDRKDREKSPSDDDKSRPNHDHKSDQPRAGDSRPDRERDIARDEWPSREYDTKRDTDSGSYRDKYRRRRDDDDSNDEESMRKRRKMVDEHINSRGRTDIDSEDSHERMRALKAESTPKDATDEYNGDARKSDKQQTAKGDSAAGLGARSIQIDPYASSAESDGNREGSVKDANGDSHAGANNKDIPEERKADEEGDNDAKHLAAFEAWCLEIFDNHLLWISVRGRCVSCSIAICLGRTGYTNVIVLKRL